MAYFHCVYGSGSSPTPPTPPQTADPFIYNVVESGVCFNSGHKHTANTKIRMKASFPTWGNYGQAFGARSNNYGYAAFGFFPWFDGLRPCFYRTGQELPGSFYNVTPADNTQLWYGVPLILECEGNTASWYVEGMSSDVHTLTASNANVNDGIAPLGIFCCNNSTSADGWDPFDYAKYMTLYYFEIYESNTLVHRFVPAYNNNQFCLYDEIDETYIYEANGNYSRVRGSSNIPTT